MKRLSIIFLVLFALVTTLFAQTGFRSTTDHPVLLLGGLNMATTSLDDDAAEYWDAKMTPGFKAGLETYVGPLNFDLTYEQFGALYEDGDTESLNRFNYLELGVQLPYYFSPGFSTLLGLNLGYALSGTQEFTYTDTTGTDITNEVDFETDDFSFDYGLIFGLQWDVTPRFHLRSTYYYAFPEVWSDTDTAAGAKNRVLTLSALFNIL
jgi:hypothetical protein